MTKILVVEDDKALNGLLSLYLREQGYEVVSCSDGVEGLSALEKDSFSMIISDIMMPNMDGFTFAESVRTTDTKTPILFMTAKDDKASKLYAYKLGVDDYVEKPFDMDVFLLKVAALLRRVGIEEQKTLKIGDFCMNTEEHTAYYKGEELVFTVREFDILFKLLSYPKKTFTRSALMAEFWDYDSSAMSRTVDVYMAKIREKTAQIVEFEIVTVHGLGYKAVLK